MQKCIATTTVQTNSIYGTYKLIEGQEFPIFLYKKFPQYLILIDVPDEVVEEPIEVDAKPVIEEKIVKQNTFEKKRNN